MSNHHFNKLFVIILSSIALLACTPPEEKKLQYFKNGKDLFDKGDYVKARIEFSNALQLDPKFSDAFFMRGLVEIHKNNIRNAYSDLYNATQMNPQNLPAQIELVKLLLITKNFDQAKDKINELENTFSTNYDFLLIKARYLFQTNDLPGCENILTSLLNSGFKNDEGYVLLSYTFLKQKKINEAENILLKAKNENLSSIAIKTALVNVYDIQGKSEDTKKLLLDLLASEPNNINHKMAYSKFLLKNNNKEEAIQFIKDSYLKKVHDISFLTTSAQLLNATNNLEASEELLGLGLKNNQDNFEIRHMLGVLHSSKGEYDQAEQHFLDCLKLDKNTENPKIIETNTLLAQLYYNSGNIDKARIYSDHVLAINKKSTQALLIKAQLDLKDEKLDEAISGYRTVISERPNTAELYIQLAEIFLKNNQKELAVTTLREAHKALPDNGKIQVILARLWVQTKDYTSSEEILTKFIETSVDDINGYVELAKLYAIQKKYDLAESQLSKFIDKFPDNALGYIHLKNLYLVSKDINKAITAIKRGIAVVPDSLLLHEELIKLYLSNKAADNASSLCEEKIKKNENSGFYYNMLGTIALSQHEHAKAEEFFSKSMELVPGWHDPYNNLATVLAIQGKQEPAILKLEESIKVNPKDNKSYAILAALYEQSGNTTKAIETYQRSLQQFPKDWATANNLAYLLGERAQNKEELESSLKLANTAYFLNRENPTVLDTLGWIHFKMGNHTQAIHLLAEAVEKSPQQQLWNYHLGAALSANGQKDFASEYLHKSIEGDKTMPWKSEAQRLLIESKQ